MSRRNAVFVLFTLAYFLSYFFRSANAVIAGGLRHDLGLSAADLGLMTSLFYASFALVQLPIGVGLDRIGPRLVVAGTMLVSAVGCLVFASAHSFVMLALGRTLIGAGMASVLVGAIKAFGQWYPPQRLATITGLMVGVGALGGLAAATPLAWLNSALGWRAIFGWGALLILAAALALAAGAPNTPPGTSWPQATGPGLTAILGRVFSDMRFWRVAPLYFFLLGAPLAVQTLWAGPFLRDVLRLNAIAAGNLLLALNLGAVLGYMACGWLADRYGLRRVVVLATLGLIGCQLAFLPGARLPLALWYLVYALFGFCGGFNIVLLAQARGFFAPTLSGRVSSALNMFGFGGAWLLQWWMGLIVDRFAADAAGHYPPAAYAAALGFTALGSSLALAWYLLPEAATSV